MPPLGMKIWVMKCSIKTLFVVFSSLLGIAIVKTKTLEPQRTPSPMNRTCHTTAATIRGRPDDTWGTGGRLCFFLFFFGRKKIFGKKWWKNSLFSNMWKIKGLSTKLAKRWGEKFGSFLCLRGKKKVCFWLGAKKKVCTGETTIAPPPVSSGPPLKCMPRFFGWASDSHFVTYHWKGKLSCRIGLAEIITTAKNLCQWYHRPGLPISSGAGLWLAPVTRPSLFITMPQFLPWKMLENREWQVPVKL